MIELVYRKGIQTHNLIDMSLFLQPLDQRSGPSQELVKFNSKIVRVLKRIKLALVCFEIIRASLIKDL